MKQRYAIPLFGALCLSLGLLVGTSIETSKPSLAEAEPGTLVKPEPVARSDKFFDFSELAQDVQPAVVNIATTRMVPAQRGNPLFDPEQLPPQFREFFRFFGPEPPDQEQQPLPRRKRNNSLGSGVIVDPSGLVVTNYHVIKGADEIQVVLDDGSTLAADVVGHDEQTDVALLRITEGTKFPYLEFGNSDEIRVGQWVLAVGNPFGLSHTFTAGIVSAKGRQIGSDITYQDFIQTDASINPGNSGGPLLNLDGELIGVNTAIFSRTGQSAGIGFAIPSNLVRFVVEQLSTKNRVDRGYLGVLIQPVDEQIAESLGLDAANGAIVTQVLEDGPAGKAGIRVGDVIVEFNGEKIRAMSELPLKVSTTPPGQDSTVTVVRDGKVRKIKVKLGELPDRETGETRLEPPVPGPQEDSVIGLSVRALTAEERRGFRLDVDYGLMVTKMDSASPARDVGIRTGDVLLKAGSTLLRAPKDLDQAVGKARKQDKKALLVLVSRDGQNRFVGVPLGN